MATSKRHSKRSTTAAATPPAAAATRPAEAVLSGARRVADAITDPGDRSRDQWLAVVGDCQWLINTVTAVQDRAIAEAARRESTWCEDGTLGESVHVPGRVTLDAADVVAPLIGASHPQAQRRVEQAVRLAAHRVPVPAEQPDLPEASGLHGLHAAMAAGRLDGYRAGVVAFELEIAPADVADAVVTALDPHLGDDSSKLRQRTRVLLSRISPDLVRERAKRARANTGLRRWVGEPGVDEWHGTFPSEDAAVSLGSDRQAGPRPGHRRHLLQHRTGPRQSPDRPGHRPRHHRRPDHPHRPRRHPARPSHSKSPRRQPASHTRQLRPRRRTASPRLRPPQRRWRGCGQQRPRRTEKGAVPRTSTAPDSPVSGAATAQRTPATDAQGLAAPAERTDQLTALTAEPERTAATDAQGRPPAERTGDLVGAHRAHQRRSATGDDPVPDAPRAQHPAVAQPDEDPTHAPPPPIAHHRGQRRRPGPGAGKPTIRAATRSPRLAARPPAKAATAIAGLQEEEGGATTVRSLRPPHRGTTRPPRRPRHQRLPARRRAHRPGPRPRRPVPLPRLLRRRPVLRPRPRTPLAHRTHHRNQPAHPLPTPPPHQATPRLATPPGPRRHRHLDRPHRT